MVSRFWRGGSVNGLGDDDGALGDNDNDDDDGALGDDDNDDDDALTEAGICICGEVVVRVCQRDRSPTIVLSISEDVWFTGSRTSSPWSHRK